jgi:hypothetical protein
MNNIDGINNISFNQIYNPVVGRNFNSGSGLEIPEDNVNINNQNIKVLPEKLISQYLNNSNVGNNIPQNGGYSSLSDDELLRLLLLLLQYANQNGDIGNNLGYKPNFIGGNPVSASVGNFGAPYTPINGNTKAKGNSNNQIISPATNKGGAASQVSKQGNATNQVSNSTANQVSSNNQINTNNKDATNQVSNSTANQVSSNNQINTNNKDATNQVSNSAANQVSSNNQINTNNKDATNQVSNSAANQVSSNNQINTNNKIDLSVYPPEEREKVQRFLERANDAYNNPEKYTNPNNGQTAKDGSQWDMWCLGFVNNMAERKDSALLSPSAKESLQKIKEQGRLRTDWDNMPPGSYVYWGGGQYGHIAIYTGERNEKGEPIILTTGWNGFNGLHKVPLSELQGRLGAPEGFATPKL